MYSPLYAPRPQTPDSRRYKRFPYAGAVRWKGQPEDSLRAFELSSGGIGVRSKQRIGIGRPVEILLLHHNVQVEGFIRSEMADQDSGWRIGIEFLDPQPDLLAIALSLPRDLN